VEGSCYLREPLDEPSVEIAEADEFSHSSYVPWWLPVVDGLGFNRFHFEAFLQEFHSQEVDLFLVEFALFWI
jgi:hypothetical protein